MARTTIPSELVAINAIHGTLIADNAITAVHIATNAVSGTLIADNAVTSTHIAQNNVTATQILQNTITVTQLADDAVETAKINASAVTTAKINNGAVTADKLAANSVTSAKIVNGTIVAADLADDAVTIAKMAALARGKIIYGDSSGAPAALALGSNGQVLKSDGTDIAWATLSTGVDGISSSADATAITIDSSERVGIGVGSPSAKLQVDGEVRIQSSTEDGTSLFSIYNENTNPDSEQFFIAMNGSSVEMGNARGNALDFFTSDTRRMRITSGGYVGVGTTSPQGELHLVGASGAPVRLYLSDVDDGTGAGDSLLITKSGATAYIYNRDDGDLRLGTNDDNDMLTIDTNGNIGINTNSPTAKLHINNTSTTSDGDGTATETASGQDSILLYGHGGTDEATYGSITWLGGARRRAMITAVAENADQDYLGLAFYTQGTDGSGDFNESMRIAHSGKVGIGDLAPMDYLEINGSGSGLGGLTISNSTHNHAALSFARSSTATARIYTTEPDATHTSQLNFQTSNASGGSPNLVTAMIIDDHQHVGIGDTSPITNLTVGGSVNGRVGFHIFNTDTTGNSAYAQLNLGHEQGGFTGGYISHHYDGQMKVWNRDNDPLSLATNNTERMRIHAGGEVTIGTTTALSNAKLTVDGGDMMVQGANNSCGISDLLPGYTRGDYGVIYSTANHIYFKVGSSYISYINGGDGTFNVSDSRIKENIATLTGTLDKVKQLRGVSFTWKDTEERGTDTKIGLIAQEVEAVYPQLVDDGALPKDNEGNDPLKSVNYAHLTSVLIEAIKELDTKLTAAEARIKTLEDA